MRSNNAEKLNEQHDQEVNSDDAEHIIESISEIDTPQPKNFEEKLDKIPSVHEIENDLQKKASDLLELKQKLENLVNGKIAEQLTIDEKIELQNPNRFQNVGELIEAIQRQWKI